MENLLTRTGMGLAIMALLFPAIGFAQSLTIQGKVLDGSNNPVSGSATQFRVQILTPDSQRCILFDETRTVDLTSSGGLFSLNLNDGLGIINSPTGYTLDQALSNRATFSVNSSYCASGSGTLAYSPSANDNRKVVIKFRDPATMASFETIPEMDLNPVAWAMESRTVGGFGSGSLLRVVAGGTPGTAPTLTNADVTELQSLIAGSSAKYLTKDAATGAALPAYSGSPPSATAGSVWFDASGSGTIKYKDSSGVIQTLGTGSGGGTITSITAGMGLSGGGSSGTVSLGLSASGVTGAGTAVGSASSVPVITYDSYGRITAATTAAISGTLPSGTSGQFLRSSGGTTWAGAGILMGDLKNAAGTGPLFGAVGCSASQAMYWNSGSDQILCQNISVGNGQIADLAWSKITGAPSFVADEGGTPSFLTDVESALPTVHAPGRIFVARDTKKIFRDNGTTWDQLTAPNGVLNALNTASFSTGPTSARPTGQSAGRVFIDTTLQKIQYDNGTTWIDVASNGGTGFSGSLGGEVRGTQGATSVNNIGGILNADIVAYLTAVQNATDAGTASRLVKRDTNGDFAGRKITSLELIVKGSAHTASFTADPSADYSLKLPDTKATVDGQVLSSDTNGVLSWASPSSSFGGIAVTAPITNTSGTIGMPSATTSRDGYLTQADWNSFSGKLSSALNSALIWVGDASNVATPVAPSGDVTMTNAGAFAVNKIKGTTVSAVPSAIGQVLRYDGTDYTPAFTRMADLRSTATGSSAITGNCTASQTLTWNSGTDSLQCQDISVAAASQLSGIVPVSNGGTGTSTGSITGTGALAFTAGGSNQNVSLAPSGTGYTLLGGKVGIGTNTPSSALSIAVPEVSSGRESLMSFRMNGDANTIGGIGNLTSANGAFGPMFFGYRPGSFDRMVTSFRGFTDSAGDVAGTENALVDISGVITDNNSDPINGNQTVPNNRNIFSISSWDGPLMAVSPKGRVGIGSFTPSTSLDLSQKTDAVSLPRGTTGEAPAATVAGRIRWNSSNAALEVSNGSSWVSVLAGNAYSFSTGTTGNAPNWSNTGNSYTLNLPLASAGSGVTAGLLSNAEYIAKAPLASPTFTGTPAAPTASADTNTTQLATTAFVVGQASSSVPVVNSGVGSVGTSLRYAREDHAHPTDTSRAPAAGSTAITTLGTITTGSWNGTTIAVANGGTGSTNGSIAGSGPLTFAAGGSNQNVALTPSGTGYVLLNGNVGIGTTSPGQKLSVGGTIESTSGGFKFPDGTTQTSAASSGNSSPIFSLCTNAQSLSTSYPSCYQAAQGQGIGLRYRAINCSYQGSGATGAVRTGDIVEWAGSTWRFRGQDGSYYNCYDGSTMIVDTTATGGSYVTQWSSNASNIYYNTGNVGIGTSAPTSKLEVTGGSIVADAQTSSGQCINFATGNMQVSSYASTNSIKLGGLADGGAYSLVLTGYTAGQTITVTGFTDTGCTAGISSGVDFGGSSSAITNTFTASGNTQVLTFLYSSNRGVAYASASTKFYR